MPEQAPLIAAVDLGSNSFHMIVGLVEGADFRVLDRLKEPVRLGAGLDEHGALRPDAQQRALACLERFGQRLRELPRGSVRAVGTNTLRKAADAGAFLDAASRALGHPVEVIAGREEARLIYKGVARERPGAGRRLVVDIGGGSTELILGEGAEPVELDSLNMGCVSWSLRFFPEEEVRRDRMRQAITAARLQLETAEARYRAAGWALALGSSGTINAIERVLIESQLSPEGITPRGLRRLADALCEAGRMGRARLEGLAADRRPVLPGGLAILTAVVDALGVERMHAVQSALREGVLVDLLGRRRHEDVRGVSVDWLAERCRVDQAQAARVEATALALLDQAAGPWGLDDEDRKRVSWGARLHEAGMFLTWQAYQRHGAYIVANADLPGFSRTEQQVLAALVMAHRGKADDPRRLELCPDPPPSLRRLAALLRLAARLNRSRSTAPLPPMTLRVDGDELGLHLPEGWLDGHPLTRADLAEVADALVAVGMRLSVR